jgi:hypothetical protein
LWLKFIAAGSSGHGEVEGHVHQHAVAGHHGPREVVVQQLGVAVNSLNKSFQVKKFS